MLRILKRFFLRIGVWTIIKNHYNTFYDASDKTEHVSIMEIVFQTCFFIALSILLTAYVYIFTPDVLQAILTIQTILTAFLFVSLFTIADKRTSYKPVQQEYKITRDTVNNIAFCVLLSVLMLMIIVTYIATYDVISQNLKLISKIFYYLFNICIYFCIIEQIYVLLMVIRRVNKIFS